MKIAAITVAAVLAAGCSGGSGGSDDDAAALLACQAFRELANDYATLTAPELRERLQDIDGHAKVSVHPAISGGARTLLIESTQTGAVRARDVTAFGNSCSDLGY